MENGEDSLRGYIAATDFDWYTYLASLEEAPDEVNFWQPSSRNLLRKEHSGCPFFFKLKSPYNAIAGFGTLSYTAPLQASTAWEFFGTSNGAASRAAFIASFRNYRNEWNPLGDFEIGCLMILQPVFLPQEEWIAQPRDWKPNIQRGTFYDLTQGEGLRILSECQLRATGSRWQDQTMVAERYGKDLLIRPRLGQGSFKAAILDAYGRACAVSEEHSEPVLEAAHIRP